MYPIIRVVLIVKVLGKYMIIRYLDPYCYKNQLGSFPKLWEPLGVPIVRIML